MSLSVNLLEDGAKHKIASKDLVRFDRFLRDELSENTYFIVKDEYVLPNKLKREGEYSLQICNAGGKSEISEAFSIDYFNRIHNSYYTIFEKQVEYWIDYKMVDYVTSVFDDHYMEVKVGVSVTRAMLAPGKTEIPEGFGQELLDKKIRGLIIARNSVLKHQKFFHSILHIWCQSVPLMKSVVDAAIKLDPVEYGLTMKGSFCVLATLCENPILYTNVYQLDSLLNPSNKKG